MTKQEIFKAAHAMTRATIQAGDSYAVTFAAALRAVYAGSGDHAMADLIAQTWAVVQGDKGLTWKRGTAGGTTRQKEYADKVVPFCLPAFAVVDAKIRGNGTLEEAVRYCRKIIKQFDRDASRFLNAYANHFSVNEKRGQVAMVRGFVK